MKRGRPRKENPKASTERSRKSREIANAEAKRVATEAKRRAIVLRHAPRPWLVNRLQDAHGRGELTGTYIGFDDSAEVAAHRYDQCEMEEHAKWEQWCQLRLGELIASLPDWKPEKR